MTFFDNAVAYAKRSKVDVNAMKRDYFTTLLLKKNRLNNFDSSGISLRRRRQWETQIVRPSICLYLF